MIGQEEKKQKWRRNRKIERWKGRQATERRSDERRKGEIGRKKVDKKAEKS